MKASTKHTSSNSKHKKYKLKSSTSSTYLKKRLNKYKYFRYRHTTHNHMQLNSLNTTLSPNRTNNNKINNYNYKLPILTRIELVPSNDETNQRQSTKTKILFNDYLLISSKTKYKYLLYSLFEQVNLLSKQNYSIVDGYLQLKNWQPISLSSISTINQCFKKLKNPQSTTDNDNQSKNNSVNSNISSETETTTINNENGYSTKSISDNKNSNNSINSSGGSSWFHSEDLVTVYDILSHVVSFANIVIRVKPKNKPSSNENTQENMQSQQSCSQDNSTVSPLSTLPSQGKELESKISPQSCKANNKANPVLKTSKTAPITTPNNVSLKQEHQDCNNSPKSQIEEEVEDTNQAHKSVQNLTSNLSLLYSNPQLANLLPLFNLPIISQLLNGIKNNQQQQQQESGSPPSSSNQETNLEEECKTEPSYSDQNISNQPLNLCKEINTSSSKQNSSNVNSVTTKKTNYFASNQPSLSVNTSNSKQLNTFNANSLPISFSNASPSPSLSSASSSSSSHSSSSYSKLPVNQLRQQQQQDLVHTANSKFLKDFILNDEAFKTSTNQPAASSFQKQNSVNNRRQRERTTFDPQEEITRLMQVFEKTHHPTRYQIANICDSLNALACRKDKKPLEPYNIQYWFKNARAALRRKVKGDSTAPASMQTISNETNKLLNTPTGNLINDDFVTQVLNAKPSSAHLLSQTNETFLNGADDDESNLDDDDLNDDDECETNFNDNYDLNNNFQNGSNNNENHFNENENQTTSDGGLNNEAKNNDNIEQNENSNPYNNDDCDYQDDDLSFDGDDNQQEALSNSQSVNNNGMNNNSNFNGNGNAKSSIRGSVNGNRRNRVFIDPISEVPILEHYFSIETYPDHYLIEKICDNLNKGEYRYKFPKLESRNIQLWFKNHRAKLKRLKSTNSSSNLNQTQSNTVS